MEQYLKPIINKASTLDAQILGYEYWFDDNYDALQFVTVEPFKLLASLVLWIVPQERSAHSSL